ncbi:EF-hand domain-containing protein [Phenylobacterium sp.]|uniref:EF-hand domain-containing protein n=1 Tax=Phenylobacterium sp. TaxID=1871053 RepID=UPI0011FBF5E5|nr:EF-hand domain-containing protein [Phenylobacterium sp.]THD51087.1 MAG: EF-hand domain-containing protein [Phenylobacterium sp.]
MSMDISSLGGSATPHAMSGASYGAPPQQKMSNLFDSMDMSGTGSIDKTQFANAFATKNPPTVFKNQGVDTLFSQLDPTGSGEVSKSDFVSVMSGLMASLRADPAAPSAPTGSVDASTQALSTLGTPQSPTIDIKA